MTNTHTKTGRECRTKGEHGLPILPLPFIYPSLYQPPPPSFSLSFVWVWPESGGPRQKNAACHGERAKVLVLQRGGGGWRGRRVSGLERHCQSCGYPLLFLGSLLIRRLPRPSLLSLVSLSVHLFLGPLSFSGARDGNEEKGKCDRCLARSCLPV